MNVEVLRAAEMPAAHWQQWDRWVAGNPQLASPYFQADFARAVASVRDDVRVAVITDRDGRLAGFYAFQQLGQWGRPLGGRLSDYQGIVCGTPPELTAERLVRGMGLRLLDFDHMIPGQRIFEPHFQLTDRSPILDLAEGYAGYLARRRELGFGEVAQTLRKARKLEREIGPLRFEPHTDDPQVFDAALRWKSDQYRRTGATDVFAFEWTRQLLQRILSHRGAHFAGQLSALYCGDELVAAHLGMRSRQVWHYWFPAYNPKFGRYSVGLILLLRMAEFCGEQKISQLDLGRGQSRYKLGLMTGFHEVGHGSADTRPLGRMMRRSWQQTQQWLRNSPLRQPIRIPARMVHYVRGWLEFR